MPALKAIRVKTSDGWQDIALQSPSTVAQVSIEPWHYVGGAGEPAFLNGNRHYDNHSVTPGAANLRNVGFRKTPDGKVQLRGLIEMTSGSASWQDAFTLPVGYRPPINSMGFSVPSGSGVTSHCQITVFGTGVIQTIGTGLYANLDGVEFSTDQVTFPAGQSSLVVPILIEPWHTFGAAGEPAFQTSWVNFGVPYSAAGFRKKPDGKVEFRGMIKSGGSGSVAFTLPVGYRPPSNVLLSSNANNTAAVLTVQADGVCIPTGSNVYFQLDGLEFVTDQTTFPAGMPLQTLQATLPSAPVDGQEILYQAAGLMATDGVVWHLRYRAASASAYKWEFVGGGSLYDDFMGANTFNSFGTGSWGNIDTNDPEVTVPLAGEYVARANVIMGASPGSCTIWLGLRVGAVDPTTTNASNFYNNAAHVSGGCPIMHTRKMTCAAGDKVMHRYYHNTGGGNNLTRATPSLELRPLRVG